MSRGIKGIGEFVQVGLLKPHPENPRKNDEAVELIANSIRKFGFVNPVTVNIREPLKNTIVCGHTRYKAARSIGMINVPVIYVDLSEKDHKLLMIADNKLGEKAEWNDDLLKDLLSKLDDAGENLDVLGFSDEELDMILLDTSNWDESYTDIMDDIDNEVSAMETDIRRGMLFDFNQDDYERLLPLQRKLREDDIYMGSTIVLALERLYEDTQS